MSKRFAWLEDDDGHRFRVENPNYEDEAYAEYKDQIDMLGVKSANKLSSQTTKHNLRKE